MSERMKPLTLKAVRKMAMRLHDREWMIHGPCMDTTLDVDPYNDLDKRQPGRGTLAREWFKLYGELEWLLYQAP